MLPFPIFFDRTWLESWARTQDSSPERFFLALQAAQRCTFSEADQLQVLQQPVTGWQPLPHQIAVAQRVLQSCHGRAILADEVGLGKTIEAGLILKEYWLRGQIQRALILAPASLVVQWVQELQQRFHLPARAQKAAWMWSTERLLVASLDTAKRSPHREEILAQEYDLLIVDEAHRLKNAASQNWKFVNQIQKTRCLFLTATPMHNRLAELHSLVSLLYPGRFGTKRTFVQQYREKTSGALADQVSHILLRTQRATAAEHLPQIERRIHCQSITLSPPERALYDAVTDFICTHYQQRRPLPLLMLQKEICSSRDAAFFGLLQRIQKDPDHPAALPLLHQLRAVDTCTKADHALELIQQLHPEKVVLFTTFYATQDMLLRRLAARGIRAIAFRGSFSRNKKAWMMEQFQQNVQVLVATEAGGEGLNLQCCCHLIHFDLPWNPMRLEQRIGRLHRLGQTRHVNIHYLVMQATIEEHIWAILQKKMQLLHRILGPAPPLLADERAWEQQIFHRLVEGNEGSDAESLLCEGSPKAHAIL